MVQKIFFWVVGVGGIFFGNLLVTYAAPDLGWFALMATEVYNVLQTIIPTLVALALALFLWGCVQFIMSAGDEKVRGEGKQKMMWGIVGLFVIVSVWGLVALISEITDIGPTNTIRAPQAIFNS